jgi:CBS domain-containing protein
VAKISDVMTPDPITLDIGEPIIAAARAMKDRDVGGVVVEENGKVRGIVTDRDIVVRAVAEGRGPEDARLGDVCSGELTSIAPDADVSDAVRLMREKSVRRLPVLSDDRPVGIVSLGDLAMEQDFGSVLGEISSAPGNT